MILVATNLRAQSLSRFSTQAIIALSYVPAYLTAIAFVGLVYLFGIFDVEFSAPDSFAVKLFDYVNKIVS